jgi:quercetin dioxygenase-like cupin family protein
VTAMAAQQLLERLERMGLGREAHAAASWTDWANGPGEAYAAHRHGYDKVIEVARGAITFHLLGTGHEVHLAAGDLLQLPAGTEHAALVSGEGVACLELHLPAGALAALRETARADGT